MGRTAAAMASADQSIGFDNRLGRSRTVSAGAGKTSIDRHADCREADYRPEAAECKLRADGIEIELAAEFVEHRLHF